MVAEARHLPPGKYRAERRMQKDAEGGSARAGKEQLQHFTLTNEIMYHRFYPKKPHPIRIPTVPHGLNALGFIQFLAKHSSQIQGRGTKYFLHTCVCMHAMDNHKLLVTEPFWGHMCTQCTAKPNRLGFSTVSASTEALVTTTQEQSKRGTCKRAKWPERNLSKKIDTQKMSKGSAMSTEHNLCDGTSRGASDAVGNAIAGSPNCNNALQRTVMPPLFPV